MHPGEEGKGEKRCPARWTEKIGNKKPAQIREERKLFMADNIKFMTDRQKGNFKTMDGQKEVGPERTYQEVEVFGVPALFDNARIRQEDVPEGLYRYDLRGADCDPGEPVAVERYVTVNHAASILTPVPLPIPEQGFLQLGEELNFVGGMMAAREFMAEHSGMNLDFIRAGH